MNTPSGTAAPATRFEPLHPNARWGLRLSNALLLALPIAGPSAVALAGFDAIGSPGLRLALWLALAAAAFVAGWRLGDARHRATQFAFDASGLRIRRGLWWRTQTLVPRSRVQHTDIAHGPLDRRLGLATLKVYTAGTRLAQITLAGLPEARAVELRDALVTADADAV